MSPCASATPSFVTVPSYTFTPPAPAAPTGLGFSEVGALGMTLAWADNATNEVGYAVWRSTDGANYEFVVQAGANTTSPNPCGGRSLASTIGTISGISSMRSNG